VQLCKAVISGGQLLLYWWWCLSSLRAFSDLTWAHMSSWLLLAVQVTPVAAWSSVEGCVHQGVCHTLGALRCAP